MRVIMKKLFIFILIIAALQGCGQYNSEHRASDRGSDNGISRIPPSYAHPAGGTMDTD